MADEPTGTLLWSDLQPTVGELTVVAEQLAVVDAEQKQADADEREFRLMRRMLKIMDLRLRGDITQAAYISRTDAVRAKFTE